MCRLRQGRRLPNKIRQLHLSPRALRRVALHVPQEEFLLGWLVWLACWEWLLPSKDLTGEMTVHIEDFYDTNARMFHFLIPGEIVFKHGEQ